MAEAASDSHGAGVGCVGIGSFGANFPAVHFPHRRAGGVRPCLYTPAAVPHCAFVQVSHTQTPWANGMLLLVREHNNGVLTNGRPQALHGTILVLGIFGLVVTTYTNMVSIIDAVRDDKNSTPCGA
jgi:hypothetical protein